MVRSRNRGFLRGAIGALFCFCSCGCAVHRAARWGVDAANVFAEPVTAGSYADLLKEARVGFVRVRDPRAAAFLHARGFRVVSFLRLGELPIEQRGDQLPEDLLKVYEAARRMEAAYGSAVDAWEMVGEPDTGFCHDLPDRVTAFQKAVYLGIHSAAPRGEHPIVLMGALGLPPGPWLEQATRNDLLEYTDAYNFHLYGWSRDCADVIRAHAAVAKRVVSPLAGPLPLWITESGFDAVDPVETPDDQRRRIQAGFILTAAEHARRASRVAVFMPFVLAHEGDPYALTMGPDRPLPAWREFADYAAKHPFPERPLANPPANPNPVVVQWLPDLDSAIPNKPSGSYRFWQSDPLRGKIRIYDFGATPVHGSLTVRADATTTVTDWAANPDSGRRSSANAGQWDSLEIPAHGRLEIPVAFASARAGYWREKCDLIFRDEHGRTARAEFGLETSPREEPMRAIPLALERPPPTSSGRGEPEQAEVTAQSGAWIGSNGLELEANGDEVTVWAPQPNRDPLRPTLATTRVHGLPAGAFLRVQLDRPLDSDFRLRVDLIDADGQRFSIPENGGAGYFDPTDDLWLNLADFGPYFWGRCTEHPTVRPEAIRVIELRCFFRGAEARRQIRLSLLQPARD